MLQLPSCLSYPFKGYISLLEFQELQQTLQLSEQKLIQHIMQCSHHFTHIPISHFPVSAIVKTSRHNFYLGHNLEVRPLSLNHALHAEQSAIINAWMHNEKSITDIYISAMPCGHCRQFMTELIQKKTFNIHVNDHCFDLHTLLPYPFTPQHLNETMGIFNTPLQKYNHDNIELLLHLNASYAPYSRNHASVAIHTEQNIIYGRSLESVAYNPSVSPLISALNHLRYQEKNFNNIKKIILLEKNNATFSYIDSIKTFAKQYHISIKHQFTIIE